MRPLLVAGLAASLALSALAAWWPPSDDTTGLLPAARAPGRVAGRPGPAAVADLRQAPALPLPLPSTSTQPGAVAPPVVVATPPAASLATATTATTATVTATLPTRAADWPAPGAAALAAWQGAPAAKPVASASASASASANPAASAAPPLPVFPYQWIGQLDDGGTPQVLLTSAQRSVGVRRGAVLDGRWRLDRAPGEPWKATHLPSGLVVAVRGAPSVAEP